MMNLSIGQIVFVLIKKTGKLVPARVVEERVTRTLQGQSSTFMLEFDPSKPPLDASKIEAEMFENAEQATNVLLDRIMSSVQKAVENAQAAAAKLFGAHDTMSGFGAEMSALEAMTSGTPAVPLEERLTPQQMMALAQKVAPSFGKTSHMPVNPSEPVPEHLQGVPDDFETARAKALQEKAESAARRAKLAAEQAEAKKNGHR